MRRLTFYISLLMALECMGQGVSPTRDVEATDDGIIVTYRFNGGFHQDDPLHPGAKFWKIPGFALNDVAGEPSYSFHWDTFAVPDDCDVSLTLIDSAYTDTLFTLAPAYPPLWNSNTDSTYLENVSDITPYLGRFPNCTIKHDRIQHYRGQGFIRIVTMPVQYDMHSQTVRSFSLLKYKVSFTHDGFPVRGRSYVSSRNDRRVSLSDPFLENITLNYSLSDNGRKNIRRKEVNRAGNAPDAVADNRDYLIISTPTYAQAANRLAEWKRTKGFRTHVVLLNTSICKNVKTTIMDLYNTEGVNLYYVLFMGESTSIPAYMNRYDGLNYRSDYYYGYMEDTIKSYETRDVFPSVRRGRLLSQNVSEVMDIIDKIIAYEKTPPQDSVFYSNGLHCAQFLDELHYEKISGHTCPIEMDSIEDRRFVLTSEEIKDYVQLQNKIITPIYYTDSIVIPLRWNNSRYANGDSIPLNLRKPDFNWNGSTTEIINHINSKKFYVLYHGHGEHNKWFKPYLDNSHIPQLNNSVFQPVVFSIACRTGNYIQQNCLAERFLKNNHGGCVSIIAASELSISGYNDSFAEGMFNAIWPTPGLTYHFPSISGSSFSLEQPIYDMGSILDYGLFFMSNFGVLSNDPKENNKMFYNREIYHLFGDPSMMIYTEQPTEISNPHINVKGDTIKIRTTDGEARISFYTPGTIPKVDSYIGNSVDYPTTADSLTVCIDRHNCIPYIFTYHKSLYIQNETLSNNHVYVGKNIFSGRSVTIEKPEGDVVIDDANLIIYGGNVELHPGTTVINSNVVINPQHNNSSE